MEQWVDQGIVLSARSHGEGGAVVALLTESHGRHAGYVHGGMSSAKRSMLQPGTVVRCEWGSRVSENLGNYTLEAERSVSPDILQDSLKLAALQSACALCDVALPEREGHPGLFHGFTALLEALEGEHWSAVYVMWEIALLKELGFHLELDKCAGGGDPQTLKYVSPKSGRAVSEAQAAPYKEKLLELPLFLQPSPDPRASLGSPSPVGRGRGPRQWEGEGVKGDHVDVLKGLKMTAHFLEHWVFIHHTNGLPTPRSLFQERFAKNV